MANTLSVMTNVLRNVVSKKRYRYVDNGYNLDLTYITENIIAMGYPAEKIEGCYRNHIDDVYQFFEETHRDHYKIYNLCSERNYDTAKFHNRVATYPFADHNPPTIELIQQFCDDVDRWLKAHSNNVAAIHCKAGKGRTGTMICCYLLYCGFKTTARDSLAYYDEKRTKDKRGVTIPSQRRYVDYFSKIITHRMHYERRCLEISEIRFSSVPLMYSQGSVQCSISNLQNMSSEKVQLEKTLTVDFRQTLTIEVKHKLMGDVKVEIFQEEVFQKRKKYFHFWFNTYFLYAAAEKEDDILLVLNKSELDDAHKDKDHKSFADDFKVSVVLKAVSPALTNGFRNDSPQKSYFPINNVSEHLQPQPSQLNNRLSNSQMHEPTSSSPTLQTAPIPTNAIAERNMRFVDNNRKSKPPQMQHQQTPLPPISYKFPQQQQHQQHQQQTQSEHRVYENHKHLVKQLQQQQQQHHNQLQRQTPSVSPEITRTNSKNSNTSTISTNSSSSSISSSSSNSQSSSAVGEDWESENLRNENSHSHSQSEEGKDSSPSPRVSLNKHIIVTNKHHSSIDEEDNDEYNLITTTSPSCTSSSTTNTTMSSSLSRRHSNLPLSIGVKSMLSKNFKTRPRREST